VRSLCTWDCVHFVDIAQCGYQYEHQHAFYPLLPLCVRYASKTVLAFMRPYLGTRATLVLIGLLLTNGAFVASAACLYQLSRHLLPTEAHALWAVTLYSVNPASVFGSAVYTESVFALFTNLGFLSMCWDRWWLASVALTLAAAARSNGFLHSGAFGLRLLYVGQEIARRPRKRFCGEAARFCYAFLALSLAVQCLLPCMPMILFEAYARVRYCTIDTEDTRPWCQSMSSLYAFVQDRYWGVGFLKYFEWKQAPNFGLAMPALLLSLCSLWATMRGHLSHVVSAGLWSASFLKGRNREPERDVGSETRIFKPEVWHRPWLRTVVLSIAYEQAILLFAAIFVMNVQVVTRLISALPLVYWWIAKNIVDFYGGRKSSGNTTYHVDRMLVGISTYYGLFVLLGCVLYSNFYPWT